MIYKWYKRKCCHVNQLVRWSYLKARFLEHFLGGPIKSLRQCPMPVPYIGNLPFRWPPCPQFLAESLTWEHTHGVIGATTSFIQPEINKVSSITRSLEIFLDPPSAYFTASCGVLTHRETLHETLKSTKQAPGVMALCEAKLSMVDVSCSEVS